MHKKNVWVLICIGILVFGGICWFCMRNQSETRVAKIIVTAMPENEEYEMTDKKEIKSFLDEIDDMKLEKTSFDAGSLNGAAKAYEIIYENGDSTQYIINSGYLGKTEKDKIQWYQIK